VTDVLERQENQEGTTPPTTGPVILRTDPTAAPAVAAPTATKTPLSLSIARVCTGIGLYLVLFLVFELLVSSIPQARAQSMLLASFREDVLAGTASQTTTPEDDFSGVLGGADLGIADESAGEERDFEAAPEPPAIGEPVAFLVIPRLSVEQVVVQGTRADQLADGPGHFRNTVFPGQIGNSAIAGARVSKGAVFRHLDQLSPGDEIRAVTGQGSFVYEVTTVEVLTPGDADPVQPSRDTRLTLVTSNPAFVARDELVVTAALRSQPVRPLAGQRALAIDEGERNGAPGAGALARFLVWTQLLILAVIAARRLYARWAAWPTWLISTPVLLLLCILSFEALAGLLPATF